MVSITCKIEINAPVASVWSIISDLDSEPKFWKGTKSVENMGKDGAYVIRKVTLAFQDKVCEQRVRLEPPTSVMTEFTRGIIKGTKAARISAGGGSTSTLTVMWDIAMTGMMSVFTPVITRHVRSGTEAALEAIKKEAESQ